MSAYGGLRLIVLSQGWERWGAARSGNRFGSPPRRIRPRGLNGIGVSQPAGANPHTPHVENVRIPRGWGMAGWRSGPRYQKWKLDVVAMWGTTCHLCGHGGAHDADHLTPLSVWPTQPYDPTLSRPAHGVAGCPTCHVKCNQTRGAKSIERAYERKLD